MTKLNVAALAAIASAPPPPAPKVEGAVVNDTTVSWPKVPGAAAYVVRWRRTDANQWQENLKIDVAKSCRSYSSLHAPDDGSMVMKESFDWQCSAVLPHIRVDDWVFGVSSVSEDGFESPVASAVPGGAFRPYVAPAK
jgi:hypothetical protein